MMCNPLFCKTLPLPDLDASRRVALAEYPANALVASGTRRPKRALGQFSKFWAPGRTLTVGFFNDTSAEHQAAIENVARQWLRWANLKFEFVDSRFADIRIFTGGDDNYSHVGTDALLVSQLDATLALGTGPEDPLFARTVLHEFGHVLGLLHEHQHPKADIPWDIPKLYAYFAAKGIDRQTVDINLLNKTDKALAKGTAYDRASIMHYAVLQEQTLGDWEIGINHTLSRRDRIFARRVYPKVVA
jgi:hypothetical protein